MEKNDFKEFKSYLSAFADISGSKKTFTAAGIAAYFSVLEDLSIEEFKEGLKIACKKNKFFPAPAEIIEAINGDPAQKAADLKIEAEQQAMEVWEKICCRGGTGLEITKKAEATIQAMGGWQACGQTLESEGKWWRKRFVEIYESMSEQKQQEIIQGLGDKRESQAVSARDLGKLLDLSGKMPF